MESFQRIESKTSISAKAPPLWSLIRSHENKALVVLMEQPPARVRADGCNEAPLLAPAGHHDPDAPGIQDLLPTIQRPRDLVVLVPNPRAEHLDPRVIEHRGTRETEFEPRSPQLGVEHPVSGPQHRCQGGSNASRGMVKELLTTAR